MIIGCVLLVFYGLIIGCVFNNPYTIKPKHWGEFNNSYYQFFYGLIIGCVFNNPYTIKPKYWGEFNNSYYQFFYGLIIGYVLLVFLRFDYRMCIISFFTVWL